MSQSFQSFISYFKQYLVQISAIAAMLALFSIAPLINAQEVDPQSLTIRARGTSGQEQVVVYVAEQRVTAFSLTTQLRDFTFNTDQQLAGKTVRVSFVNDNGTNRDVFIDHVQANGKTYQTEAADVLSLGSWNGSCGEGRKQSQWLHCNGWFQYSIDSDTVTPDPDPDPNTNPGNNNLVIHARGISGQEQVEVRVAGQKISSFTLSNQRKDYSFNTDQQITGNTVQLSFINDNGSNRDVFVDYIKVNGEIYQTEASDVLSLGSWNGSCGEGRKQLQWLHCNGWFQYSIDSDTVTPDPDTDPKPDPNPDPNTGSNTILVRAKGTSSQEQVEIHVAGQRIAAFTLSTQLKDYTYSTDQSVDDTTIRVTFTNDNGSNRDVFVDYIKVNGETLQTEASDVLSLGSWNGSCNEGRKQSQWLHCSGWFQYSTGGEVVTPDRDPDPKPDPDPDSKPSSNKIATYDTAWELLTFAKTDQEIINYFDHLQAKGYDGVLLSMLNHTNGFQYGTSAYHGQRQSTVSGSSFLPTDTHLNYTAHVLDLAHQRGLRVGLVPAWSVAYVNDPSQPRATKCNQGVLQPHNAYAFGDKVGKRLGTHPAIEFFIMGGDNLCQLPSGNNPAVIEQGDIWRNMASALYSNGAKQVTYHTSPAGHLNSYHLASQYAGESWVSFLFPETGSCAPAHESTKVIQKLVNDFNKPVFASEMRYFSLGADWCSTHTPQNPVNANHIKEDINGVIAAGATGYAYGDWNRWNWCITDYVGRTPYSNPCQSQGVPFTYNSAGENAVFEVVRN